MSVYERSGKTRHVADVTERSNARESPALPPCTELSVPCTSLLQQVRAWDVEVVDVVEPSVLDETVRAERDAVEPLASSPLALKRLMSAEPDTLGWMKRGVHNSNTTQKTNNTRAL